MNRREVRKQLREKMRAVREQVAEIPVVKQARERRRRRRRIIMLCILLLLAALLRCDCGEGPIEDVPDAGVDAGQPGRDAGTKKGPQKPMTAKIGTQRRGGYGMETPAPPAWLDEFMIQVTARSPRLAQCFTGQDRPGVIRWTSSINARTGVPSDHELELVGGGNELHPDQRKCVLGTLSNPPYKLTAPDAGALPNRISVVLEF